MKFHSPKKFWEIPKILIKTTEVIGSISYSRATYSEILNPILDICPPPPPAGFFNTAQKPLGVGS